MATRSVAPRRRVRTRRFVRVIVAPGSAQESAALRHDLADWLEAHPRKDDAIDAVVELVENAVKHGSRPGGLVTIEVERLSAGRLSICVRDEGRTDTDALCITTPPGVDHGSPPGFNHGLQIVKDRSEQVDEVDLSDGGREVRAILAATAPSIIEPDVDLEDLLNAYPDGDPDSAPGGVDGVS